ncbi:nicotinate (nicotinamide) nucleotide adenylyltransferase [Massiliimalia timonensis]|uniref:Probable nicotinate-nucleotide adenylyltransferase n=1 Tax=Massiliimalia timonensis TaxID=1987501 RepID=A0A8J6P2Z5_9FIRM|nr:nicotinate (nicotinamide) nucleotide adenylyltransferase [Massiliimalia timonensis]MBC8610113.1 nicotinate (nicotinamide) nucleotide adenylyltransferase [Massiliimalia timonensis]MBS7176783.1 nicotinate (nicotinamide) nucleotide adenylyltransferase [Clostridiales bacterium]
MKQKVAVFGGTFNPIHLGHLHLCAECQREYQFQKIILMPDNLPPHKQVQQLATAQQRLDMCRLAAEDIPFLEVSDLELRLKGVSYTVQTLRKLTQNFPEVEWHWIIGSDMLYTFHQWYRYEEILSMAKVVAGAREQAEYDKMLSYREQLGPLKNRVEIIRLAAKPLSSTQVRKALETGEPVVRDYLPEQVFSYIREHGLYQGKGK